MGSDVRLCQRPRQPDQRGAAMMVNRRSCSTKLAPSKVLMHADFAKSFSVKVAKVSAPFSIFPAFQRRCTLVCVACCSLFRGVFLARAASLKKRLFVVFRLFSKGADV